MLTHWLQQQTEKQRARQRAKGFAIGQAQTDAIWREWYRKLVEWHRQQLDKGFALDDLPPPPPPPENPDSKE